MINRLGRYTIGGGFLLLAAAALVLVDQLANGAVTKAWVQHYNNVVSNSQDNAAAIVRDSAGNIIVAGYTHDGAGSGLLLLKYSASGSLIWQRRYDGVDLISAAAVDAQGNVAVAGYSSNAQDWDFFTAKYSADGVLVWTRKYAGPSDDRALAVAFDSSGNVVVTGGSSQHDWRNDDDDLTAYDYYTAKYAAADGAILWERRYNGPGDRRDLAQAVVIDANDNVVVAGSSYGSKESTDFYTVKYAGADGALLWDQRYDGGGEDRTQNAALALDAAGNVVVAGSSSSTEGYHRDAHTIKYAGTNGAFLWERRYDGPAHHDDVVEAVAVDGSGNVIVTGLSVDSEYYHNAYTAKYAAADGALLWETIYSPTNRWASGQALAVDAGGNVVMTGYSISNIWDHYTAKYAAADGALLWERLQDGPQIPDNARSVVVLDANGNAIVAGSAGGYDSDIFTAPYAATDGSIVWEQRYAGLSPGQGVGECVAVDAHGNVIVSGSSEGTDSGFDYYTAKYSPHGVLLWEKRYDGPYHGGDYVRAMALDADGNVAVTGYSQGERASDFYTVKYAAGDGAVLWERRYDGTGRWDDHAWALAVDGNGNVIVTGNSTGTNFYGPYTAKYAAATGALLWEKHASFFGGIGGADAVTVDGSGNVIVTGHHTVKYAAANGAVLWSRDFVGEAIAVKVDANGNVVVTGHSQGYYTAKYAAADGAMIWEKHHTNSGGVALPWALAVDAQGNGIVTGMSYDLDSAGVDTVKYSSADGAVLWERRHDAGSNTTSIGKAVAVDESGNVVIAGFAPNALTDDYFTAKYAAADGAVLWEQLFDGPAGRNDRVENRSGLALGPDGMVAITGVADSFPGGAWGYGLTTVVYREAFEAMSITRVGTGIRLRFTGEPGRRYAVQRAPAVHGPWETLATPETLSDGNVEHVDATPLPGSAFYRATTP